MRLGDLDQYRIAGAADFAETAQGLVKAVAARGGMRGELFLQGAQVTAWQPSGARPVIFTSPRAVFAPGKAIRGGIPVIFPWFGAHPSDPQAPQHGLARTAPWRLAGSNLAEEQVALDLALAIDGFDLAYRVVFGSDLHLSLTVRNKADRPMPFEAALHSYFAVSAIERVRVSGLEGCGAIDKTAAMARRPPLVAPLTFAQETDSVYLDVPDHLAIEDAGWGRRIAIDKTGAASVIVWNPWSEKAAAMADLGADNWRGFVCVETGNVADNRIVLAPGGEHAMTTRITVDGG
ncbi:MAG TPA: D-hexose-6-phosphate mutarotase [Stellaceae bacterium]|nr:D-hexose-6-phosphate mutarotase [Stellaceae bacterium]